MVHYRSNYSQISFNVICSKLAAGVVLQTMLIRHKQSVDEFSDWHCRCLHLSMDFACVSTEQLIPSPFRSCIGVILRIWLKIPATHDLLDISCQSWDSFNPSRCFFAKFVPPRAYLHVFLSASGLSRMYLRLVFSKCWKTLCNRYFFARSIIIYNTWNTLKKGLKLIITTHASSHQKLPPSVLVRTDQPGESQHWTLEIMVSRAVACSPGKHPFHLLPPPPLLPEQHRGSVVLYQNKACSSSSSSNSGERTETHRFG